jgi:polygalacturonase
MPTRRTVLGGIGALGIGAVVRPGLAHADPNPWARAAHLSAKVRGPRFPRRFFDITRFGAVGDGVTDCTAAIRRAIVACHRAGGGHVVVPDGQFLTGAIHLRSGVDLRVTGGARVLFSQDPAHYLPVVLTRFEGVELYNYSPLIYAFGQRNIAVTGSGVLDG